MIIKSKSPAVIAGLVVAGLLLAMSGACSQHQPGPYEGGGRSYDIPTVSGSTTTDAGPDNFIPDTFVPDTFVLPDTGSE
jgi:hypothetical protein